MTGWGDFRPAGSGLRHDTEREKPTAKKAPATGTGPYSLSGPEAKEIPESIVSPVKAIRRCVGTEGVERTWASGGIPQLAVTHRGSSEHDAMCTWRRDDLQDCRWVGRRYVDRPGVPHAVT